MSINHSDKESCISLPGLRRLKSNLKYFISSKSLSAAACINDKTFVDRDEKRQLETESRFVHYFTHGDII